MGERPRLGINGLGRIGKLTVWHHVARKYFQELVVNIGRPVGTSLWDVACFIERDSTYGTLHSHLYGRYAKSVIREVNEREKTINIDGVTVRLLMETRNPAQIGWRDYGVELVVDATGRFLDPTLPPDAPGGSCRGHLEAGARKVIVSAPFKIKDKSLPMPEDAITTVVGVNDHMYDPMKHHIISNASCTTTCLAHMMKPLLDAFGAKRVLSASMTTVHAITSSQKVLDRLPAPGETDLRKNRSMLNNIILTSTGAAQALALVLPEMKNIGFMAESVRVPVSAGSLIILVVNLQEMEGDGPIRRDTINRIYKEAAERDENGYLLYTEDQNVSEDIVGIPRAAAIIEGHETHTRTAMASVDLTKIKGIPQEVLQALPQTHVEVPITQAVIYGWYDNEWGSYTNALGDRTVSVAETMEG